MKVKSLKLRDRDFGSEWDDRVEDRWVYDDMMNDPGWHDDWISFCCAVHNPDDDRVYLGVATFDEKNIFKAYDRKTGRFVDLGYERIADPYDAKFHQSLVRASDGVLYAGIALFHDLDKYFDAPGGAIARYDPATGDLQKIATPIEHVYIQSIALDETRQRIYCLCFGPEYLAMYDLRTGESRTLGPISTGIGGMTQGENIVLDDDGCVWCTWSLTRAWQNAPGPDAWRLMKFDPEQDRMVFFQKGLPQPDGSAGYAKPEAYFNLGDGAVYASGANGSLFRIDPATGDAEFLFNAVPDRRSRLASLAQTQDGLAYGVVGRDYDCELMRFDCKDGSFEKLGAVVDVDGKPMFQCHNIVATPDGVFYASENDNPYRSSYLWEITL